ncbi:esterase/lipase family protein [Glycomyces mayteni]|uniref:Esterase/lipase family protein n=1 Tax=Glycomyces mayteni TaxID=543887 RepID=A0ABW2D988_9ACTN
MRAAVVLIHGIFSDASAWDELRALMDSDDDLSSFTHQPFEYPTPPFNFNPFVRIPDFDDLAEVLTGYIERVCRDYDYLVIVTHSQGGLILQRFLAQMVRAGRGYDLARIKRIVLYACPNTGSTFLGPVRTFVRRIIRNPQEKSLKTLCAEVAAAHREVVSRIQGADCISESKCPIPIRAYAGASDRIVRPASAKGSFADIGTILGNHKSIIRPKSANAQVYMEFRQLLLDAAVLAEHPVLGAPDLAIGGALMMESNPNPIATWMRSYPGGVSDTISIHNQDALDRLTSTPPMPELLWPKPEGEPDDCE